MNILSYEYEWNLNVGQLDVLNYYMDGLVYKRRNSIALATFLHKPINIQIGTYIKLWIECGTNSDIPNWV